MKRIILYAALLSLMFACHKLDYTHNNEGDIEKNNYICELIQRAEMLREEGGLTKGAPVRVDTEHIYYLTSTDTKSSTADTLVVVLNFQNYGGFAILPYKSDIAEYIAVTNLGFYDGTPTDIEAFNIYVDQICRHISEYKIKNAYVVNESFSKTITTKATNTRRVNPLIPVSWHQDAPFNWYCSNPYNSSVPAGCVAVAIAQSMTVAKYPATIDLTYPGATSSSVSLDWDQMLGHNSYCDRSCLICQMKAHLLREIGERVDMEYGVGGSSANTLNFAKSCLTSFGFTCSDHTDFNIQRIENSLNAGYPVIVRAQNQDSSSGHAWNIDGYEYAGNVRYQKELGTGMIIGSSTTETWYTNFKYGWGGINDGRYLSYQKITGTGSYAANGDVAVYVSVPLFTDTNGLNYSVRIFTDIRPI